MAHFEDFEINQVGSSGFNCLHAACASGNSEMVGYLLKVKKANPNEAGKNNWTSL